MDRHWTFRVLFVPLIVLVLAGCQEQEEPSRWDQAQEKTQGKQAPAVSQQSVKGGDLNRFFPHVTSPFDIVFKQEKDGLAQASLQKDGQEVAVLSIADTTNNPSAKEKYAGSARNLNGHPMAAAGSKGTSILVADRYQVQARSVDPSFGEAERIEWLQKFDLKRLANL
jgi:hypothetical protein